MTTVSEQEQIAFFEGVYARHREACDRVGLVVRTYRVAGIAVRLELAGPALVPYYTRALAHLEVDDATPTTATLCLWDSESTGVTMAPRPWQWDAVSDRGDLWGFGSDRIHTAYHYHDLSLALFDRDRQLGVSWIQSVAGLPYWTVASPLRTLFHWVLSEHGLQLVHAAAVAHNGRALLLVGKGGSGKSTTALTALEHGLDFLGDDYVVVRAEPPTVYSLFATAKVGRADVTANDRFAALRPYLYREPTPDDEKAVVLLAELFAERVIEEAPIEAIALPRVVDRTTTTFAPELPQRIQQAATLTTLAQLPYAGDATHHRIAALVAAVPGYSLELGRDKAGVAEAITSFLRDPSSRPTPGPIGMTSDRPLVSVIIPTFNGARFLPDAIASIVAQRYPSLEIIVVDDGSTDDTAAVVAALPVEVHYFKQENLGPAWARNRGIRDASGDYLAFLDVDDLFAEGAITALLDELLADEARDVVQGYSQVTEWVPETGTFESRGSPTETFPYSIASGIYRRRVFDKVGLFDPSLFYGEDRDWFRRASEADVRPHKIDAVTLIVRRHGQNMTEGKSLVELNTLRVFKLALDRKRRRAQTPNDPDAT